jgi:tetratricopeptide (TPR) repeat protein
MTVNPSQTLRTAERHLSRGKISAAIEEYRKLVNWDPSDLNLLNQLGDLYVRAGVTDQAKLIFSKVAQGYSHQGFTSKTVAILKKLLRIDPEDLDAAVSLAECYVAMGLRGQAGRQYEDIAGAHKLAGREDRALEIYQRIADINPSNTSLLLMLGERWFDEGIKERAHASYSAAADEFYKLGEHDTALAAYLKAQDALPDEHDTLSAIAKVCAALGDTEKALSILNDALARNPNDVELYKILGSAYVSAGRIGDAVSTFQKLMTLDGGQYPSLLIVGENLLETGDLDQAVQQVDLFLEGLMSTRNEQVAIDLLKKVLERDSEHPASLRKLAEIYRRLCEDFNLIPTLTALAEAAVRRGDKDEAIEAYKELCSLEPFELSHTHALQTLGVVSPSSTLAVCLPSEESRTETPNQLSHETAAMSQAVPLTAVGAYGFNAVRNIEVPGTPTEAELQVALNQIYAAELSRNAAIKDLAESGVLTDELWAASAVAEKSLVLADIGVSNSPAIPQLASMANVDTGFDLIPTTSNRRRAERVTARVPVVVISDKGWREFTAG